MNIIAFFITSNISKTSIKTFCSTRFNIPANHIQIIEDFNELPFRDKRNPAMLFIKYNLLFGTFDASVEIYTRNEFYKPFESRIDLCKSLSNHLNTNLITSDEDVHPYSFLLIEPSGNCSTISADYITEDDKDALEIGSFFNHIFGQFRLKIQQDINQLNKRLEDLFAEEFDNFELNVGTSGPVINGDFDRLHTTINELKDYQFHYSIRPLNKQKWFSIQQKSDIFKQKMIDFSKDQKLHICLFPADYSVVKNIEGGSDSEEYCMNVINGEAQKIIYKQRRKSWLTGR